MINISVRNAIGRSSAAGRPRPTVVVLGHSYGARAVSHAVAACPFFGKLTVDECRAAPTADIVIGLSGAFNRSRFLSPGTDGSYPDGTLDLYIYRDGSPIQRYDALAGHVTRHFYLWSSYDQATTQFNLIGGGQDVCNFVAAHRERFSVIPCFQTIREVYGRADAEAPIGARATIAQDACREAALHLEPSGPCVEASKPRPSGASAFTTDPSHVLLIDASGIVHDRTPLHGGGAHSDIYKWEVGKVIWQIIRDNSRPH